MEEGGKRRNKERKEERGGRREEGRGRQGLLSHTEIGPEAV